MSFPDEELQGVFCEGGGSFFVCVGAIMVGSGACCISIRPSKTVGFYGNAL